MDVIALNQAGFANVVATLGTAFTERQMERLWQLAPEPIVCFDGDKAGEAAAARAIDRMLPALREGHSFRFAFLPQGSDPDDLVRSAGPRAFAECVQAARPLIDVVWLRERSAQAIDTPERRAAFEARLEHLLAEIGNMRVRDHYRREVKNRLFALWREKPARGAPQPSGRHAKPAARSGATPLPSAYGFAATVALALVNHPWLLDHYAEEVARLEIKDRPLAALLGAVSSAIFADHNIGRERLIEQLQQSSHAKLLDRLLRESPFKRVAFLQPGTPRPEVEEQFTDLLFRWRALPTLEREVFEVSTDLAAGSDAEYEQFTALQQQVASAVSRDIAEDAGDHVFHDRFIEKIAEVTREKGLWKQGRRPEKRG
jgi:DNA primase